MEHRRRSIFLTRAEEPNQGKAIELRHKCRALCSCGSRGMASSRQTGKQNTSASICTIGGCGTRMKYAHEVSL